MLVPDRGSCPDCLFTVYCQQSKLEMSPALLLERHITPPCPIFSLQGF